MMKVLIVGAGPAGLTTAVELARRGIVSDVIDLRESGSGLSRAVGITPASLEILRPNSGPPSTKGSTYIPMHRDCPSAVATLRAGVR